jgi:hypothetical protein
MRVLEYVHSVILYYSNTDPCEYDIPKFTSATSHLLPQPFDTGTLCEHYLFQAIGFHHHGTVNRAAGFPEQICALGCLRKT